MQQPDPLASPPLASPAPASARPNRSMKIGIVVGLAAERAVLRAVPPSVQIECARGAERAEQAAQALCAQGSDVLVSFGIAGAVSPVLSSGDLLLPEVVQWREQEYATDAHLRQCLHAVAHTGVHIAQGKHAGVDGVIGRVADKHAFFERTGVLALDEESGALAAAACAHGVRLVIVRAVADTAVQGLPDEAGGWTDAAGNTCHARVLGDVLRRPSLLTTLPRMARGFARALATLRHCREPVLALGSLAAAYPHA